MENERSCKTNERIREKKLVKYDGRENSNVALDTVRDKRTTSKILAQFNSDGRRETDEVNTPNQGDSSRCHSTLRADRKGP